MTKGYVYLVGAGPGDPGLITVKGLECIKKADVIIYDRLASPRLLVYAHPDTELIYVGKSPDRHTLDQEKINKLLVEHALSGKVVTRLKGGDPFVFGRGGEEIEELNKFEIEYEVVPGVTSGISVPAYAGIPVTHREVSSSMAFVTGNEDPNKEDTSINWEQLATSVGTLVFYMGMSNLPKIVEKLISNGRQSNTPIAIIRWGTRPEQETLTGTLDDIVQKVKEAKFTNPAIIIVGEVVSLRDTMKWYERKPLFGKRVVVTRSRAQASVLSEMIEKSGGEAWEFPTIDIVNPTDWKPVDDAINKLETYDWVIFTSVNGVEKFFQRLKFNKKDIRDLKGAKICAIGPKTREEIERLGINCAFVPEEFVAEAIIEGLKDEDMNGKNILLPRADIARKLIPETLKGLGANVDDVTVYQTVLGSGNVETVKKMLKNNQIQVITFTSSSTAKNFVKMIDEENLQELLEGVVIASIGPITSDTARKLGLDVSLEAKKYTIPGLVDGIINYFNNDKK